MCYPHPFFWRVVCFRYANIYAPPVQWPHILRSLLLIDPRLPIRAALLLLVLLTLAPLEFFDRCRPSQHTVGLRTLACFSSPWHGADGIRKWYSTAFGNVVIAVVAAVTVISVVSVIGQYSCSVSGGGISTLATDDPAYFFLRESFANTVG